MSLKELVPAPVRAFVRQWQRDRLFRNSLSDIRHNGANEQNLNSLNAGWGNEGWSADTIYLAKILELAASTQGNILECGSGVSTFLLGLVAAKKVISLEHMPQWVDRVNRTLKVNGLENRVTLTSLISYGKFDWYKLPASFPRNISLVICDAPPSSTRGGRSGLVPVVEKYLAPNAIILVHDAERPEEQQMMQEWAKTYFFTTTTEKSGHVELAVLTMQNVVNSKV